MPDGFQMIVGNEIISPGLIWAHLKKRPRGRTENFALTVPLCHAAGVFGRLRDKPDGKSWLDFLRSHFREANSFEVDSWFDSVRKIARVDGQRPEWVICALTDVEGTESTVVIRGIAEEFNPGLYG